MKVGSKGRYAVMAIVDVATHAKSGAVPLAEVAARQKISLSYLEQLFAMLRRSGVVQSSRGPGGGYKLARSARETTIRQVFEAVDDSAVDGTAVLAASTGAMTLWAELDDHIRNFLDGVSVADVIERQPPSRPSRPDGVELS